MQIERVSISDLVSDPANARTHDKKNIEAIKGSLAKFGQQKPIVVGENGVVIAGNGTLEAANQLGWKEIEINRSQLTGADAVGFAIADNRTAELAAWDEDVLKEQLTSLHNEGWGVEDIGFNLEELDYLRLTPDGKTDPDEIPEVTQNVHNVKVGDVWILGEHRLMCGDSTDKATVERLMGGAKADLVHTDPPYNVDYSNQDRPKPGKKNLGRIENDKMDGRQFLAFLEQALRRAFEVTKQDSSIYIWYASRETLNFHTAAAAAAGWEINQQIIWKKPMLLGRGRYQWAHEPCVFGVKGKPFFTDDRTKTTVWDFGGYDKSKNVHPTQKPVMIPEEALKNSSKIGSNVLDLFLGSGSTLIACEKTGRKCFGMEIDPHYCSVIIERWQNFTEKRRN